jgi:hypothetical protein
MNGIKKVKTIIPNQERKRNLTKTTLSWVFMQILHAHRLKFEKKLVLRWHLTLKKWSNWHVDYLV